MLLRREIIFKGHRGILGKNKNDPPIFSLLLADT